MAVKRSKRYVAAAKLVDAKKRYPLNDAVKLLKQIPASKSDQTIDLAFKLGVDPKQSDQMVRGTVALPAGSGKNVRVLVFAKGQQAQQALAAGAEYAGFEDLIKKVTEGFSDFDVCIATPEAMNEVRKLGKVLGPRGLMPNPKTGTVTEDVAKAVKECKAGRVEFKLDKAGNVHVHCGKFSFTEEQLRNNTRAVIEAVVRAKPASAKGRYIQNCALSATFSPSIKIDVEPFIAG
jgi:large subunit ribosomal protein L1